tara:strand:- start:948 stop:1601 length:654 start_codon:yes stop_codon:yes gene_type:complete
MAQGKERSVKAAAAIAKQMFIYGDKNGLPVLDCVILGEIVGLAPDTIKKRMPAWVKEREAHLQRRVDNPLGFILDQRTVEKNIKDGDFLRAQSDELMAEAGNCQDIGAEVLELLQDLAEASGLGEKDHEKLMVMFDAYFKTTANRQRILVQYLAVQKRWQEVSGVAMTMKAHEAGMRDDVKGQKKIALAQAEAALRKQDPGYSPPKVIHDKAVFVQD